MISVASNLKIEIDEKGNLSSFEKEVKKEPNFVGSESSFNAGDVLISSRNLFGIIIKKRNRFIIQGIYMDIFGKPMPQIKSNYKAIADFKQPDKDIIICKGVMWQLYDPCNQNPFPAIPPKKEMFLKGRSVLVFMR